MKKIEFNIKINAPASLVYDKMLGEESYREWTSEFNPTSHYIGSWEKGSKIHFIGVDANGEKGGMVALIQVNIPNKYVSIEHIGLLKGETEILDGPEVKDWAGALENYTFVENDGVTNLLVEMDANEDFENYFRDTWPKALQKLKSICE